MKKEDFKTEQLTKSGTKWGVWFVLQERGVTGVSVYCDNVKAPSADKAVEKIMKALKNLEL